MIKTSLIALMTVVAVSGVAAPAFAAYAISEQTDSSTSDRYFSHTDVLARLHEQGVDATSVESWNGLIRAFVRNGNGGETQQFFTTDTLAPVTL